MFRIVGNERKRREMDPTAAMLAECLDEVKKSRKSESHTERRISDMKEFFDDTMGCFDKLNALPTGTLRKLAKMTDKVLKLLPF